jgi:hypothetical protein
MRIYFKNGKHIDITKEIGEIINKRIVEGCSKFQTFSDQNGKLILILNLEEVVCIR